MKCYDNAKKKKLLFDLDQELAKEKRKKNRVKDECDCLPSCTSIRYDADISQADYDWEEVLNAFKMKTSEIPG